MNGDSVGGRQIVAQHPGLAVGAARADPTVHDLGGVEVAARVESYVVGSDDVAAFGANGFQPTGLDVEGADLATGHLRNVDPAVGARPQAISAEQATRRRTRGQRTPPAD